jgi:DNA-directed RNA polymerase subunit M/transcription elongation factor TFIIS
MSASDNEKEYEDFSEMDISEIREKGVDVLRTVLKQEQNIKVVEKYIHRIAKNSETYMLTYRKVLYQSIGDFINEGNNLKDTVKNIKAEKVGWKHPTFSDIKNHIDEHDEFIINPFEVEEGVTTCKCGSGRVYTFQKQTRGADEPMTTFAKCVKCGTNWTYSG